MYCSNGQQPVLWLPNTLPLFALLENGTQNKNHRHATLQATGSGLYKSLTAANNVHGSGRCARMRTKQRLIYSALDNSLIN